MKSAAYLGLPLLCWSLAGCGDSSDDPAGTGASPELQTYDPGPIVCGAGSVHFASHALQHSFGPGQNAGQNRFPTPLLGGPRGAGCCAGSLDVVSLGNGGSVVLAFAHNAIVDGPGDDFVVFENAFFVDGDEGRVFAELAEVAVSEDGEVWHAFPCDAVAPPYDRCAGVAPVYANVDDNSIDPLGKDAGGDRFDLAELGLERARYVKITDRADIAGMNGVFDLDAVAILNAECP
ncbi:MAG: hypothetical protein R3B13_31485 [Polyangiaceae bacterium]